MTIPILSMNISMMHKYSRSDCPSVGLCHAYLNPSSASPSLIHPPTGNMYKVSLFKFNFFLLRPSPHSDSSEKSRHSHRVAFFPVANVATVDGYHTSKWSSRHVWNATKIRHCHVDYVAGTFSITRIKSWIVVEGKLEAKYRENT